MTSRTVLPTLFGLMLLTAFDGSAQAPATPPKPAAPAAAAPATGPVYMHATHAKKLELDCSTCHVSVKEGSVDLKRPGHEQCMTCHADWFDKDINERFCSQCHSTFPPTSKDDLKQFPLYKKQRAILFEFSHAKHVDQKARVNPTTGFRADCTFCHKFETAGKFATFPRHAECAGCHSQGVKPVLTAASTTADCRGCHQPEEIENPVFTKERKFIAPHVVSGQYVNLKFDHGAHFRSMQINKVDCTTCHYAVPQSTSLTMLSLPKMIDCVECHDTSKTIAKEFRMTNCGTCHQDKVSGLAPASHTRNVKPAFHTPSFRQHHESESTQAGAKCFVCHQNVLASAQGTNQCVGCHQVMKPTSHTARWKDDIHGKYAAIDRESCATCHTADTCERCHNEVPRSHLPLSLYKAGTHMTAAMLNQRACFTCHTFQNTCSECHTKNFKQAVR